ncbi:heavy metal translocating P-type ATPase [Methylolobus aquaticus]
MVWHNNQPGEAALRPAIGHVTIAHELPRRLRLRFPALALPGFAADLLETELLSFGGVTAVRINLRARSVLAEYDGHPETRSSLIERLSCLSPYPYLRADAADTIEPSRDPNPAPLLAGILSLLASSLLPLPLKAVIGWATVSPSLYKGVVTLLDRGIKVEVLDALAVGVAAAQGAYFTAGATHVLIETGAYLEARAEHQAQGLLRQLLQRPPEHCWIERDGALIRVNASDVREDDRVVVGAGDPIPVDGEVVAGSALVDQSSLTGESLPARKEPGDPVLAGAVVAEGRLVVRASRVGAETATARLGRVIEQSLRRPAESQRLAERLGDRLVYLTFVLGGLMFALTRDPRRAVSVFLVDYSCALKLGTPLAFIAGMHRAASAGLVFKGAQSLERLAEADTAVFDKTGTLTRSRVEITAIVSLTAERSDDELLALVASVEEHSRHPFANAVTGHAHRDGRYRHVDHGDVEYVVAHGLNTRIAGKSVQIGSRHYLEAHEGVDFGSHESSIEPLINGGNALLYVAEDTRLVGLIALRDQVREEASITLTRLRSSGIEWVVMLTGDTLRQAQALASQLPIDSVYAELNPEEKANRIEALKSAGHRIMFIGDGVNDAAALVCAQVGIAMTDGTLLCREAADVLMLREGLEGLTIARDIALETRRVIDSNFAADLAVNSALLLGATLGWLPPIAAALLHNGTTLAILVRSLRQGVAIGAGTGQRPKGDAARVGLDLVPTASSVSGGGMTNVSR